MVIKRELKNATWAYVEDRQELILTINRQIDSPPDGVPSTIKEEITLGRVHAFSLARFLIRIFFRMSMKKRRPKVDTEESSG